MSQIYCIRFDTFFCNIWDKRTQGSYGQNGLPLNDKSTKLYKLVKSAVSLDCEPSKIQ